MDRWWLSRACCAGVWLCHASGCASDVSVGFDLPLAAPEMPPSTAPEASGGMDGSLASQDAASAFDASLFDAGMSPPPLTFDVRLGASSVQSLVLECGAPCAMLELVIQGGTPPYAVVWQDGASAERRTVCPEDATDLSVVVSDAVQPSAGSSPQRVERVISVQVNTCPQTGQLCVQNPSCEGAPVFGMAWITPVFFDAPYWDDCDASNPDGPQAPHVASEISGASFPVASFGATYFYLAWMPPIHEYVGQTLCAPMRAATSYSFQVDLASGSMSGTGIPLQPAQLEIYSASDICTRDQLLWKSPVLPATWQTHCVTITAARDSSALILNATGPDSNPGAVLVDNIVPVVRCP
jgi:hypothetical protein